MDLILCHTTADFDTLGAAVGLARLRPGARIVLAGGAHPPVRDFLALHRDEYPLIERRSVNPEQIRSLVVVDAQRRDRLGKVADWFDLPNVEIEIYDHHLDTDCDIPATRKHLDAVGATTTLVAEELQAQQMTITPIEATAMALGIHVDTGSLTYDHSTARDARALAWLMEQKASLKAIGDYVDPGLSPRLQALLTTALETLQTEVVQGHRIAWVLLNVEEYIPGLSSLASRLMEVSAMDALLLAAHYCRSGACRTEADSDDDTLTVIGRSAIEGTDLNALFQPLGGGGHPSAAALNLRNVEPQAMLTQLVNQLKRQIPHPPTARELMSSPVRTVRPGTTIDEAQRVLLRYGHSGLSVVNAAGQLVGVISRRDLDIALHHGFSHAPVKGYMTTNLKTITPETPLPDIESIMVTYDVGRLPVLEKGQLVGIVTRTDVLRQLHQMGNGLWEVQESGIDDTGEELSLRRLSTPYPLPATPYSLLSTFRHCLRPELWDVLTAAAAQAEQRGWHLYLVGGAVRDFLLEILHTGVENCRALMLDDIDLVVDGFHRSADSDAGVELARSLQELYPDSRLEVHGKFQTAALLWHHDPILDSLWIDIATARTEFYPYPAANPEVEASSIRQDLYRRDFTINALAIRLTQPRAGEVLDFFGGLLDLKAKQIRVLHANSFIEDPTRIYRAVRFSVRLGFEIDAQTEGYIRHAIASGIYQQVQTNPNLKSRISAPALQTRLRAELKYILETPLWKLALKQLANLDALQCIHPTLSMDADLWRQLNLADRWLQRVKHPTTAQWRAPLLSPSPIAPWLLLLEVMLAHLAPAYRAQVAENLQLSADSIGRMQQLESAQTKIGQTMATDHRISELVSLFNQFDRVLLILVGIRSQRSVRKTIWRYLTDWSTVKPLLDGNDLKVLGYKPGPNFRRILDAIAAATLDNMIHTRDEAEAFLRATFPLDSLGRST